MTSTPPSEPCILDHLLHVARLARAVTSDLPRSLGDVAGDRREEVAEAFCDPGQALASMDDWCWTPPEVPAPFLGTQCREGTWLGATVNADGFRDHRDVKPEKPAGRRRVLVVGGSVAFGAGVPQGRTIGAYLERRLPDGWDVHTLATPAWTSAHERIAIVHRLVHLDPDAIVCLTGFNDAYWGLKGYDPLNLRTHRGQHFHRLLEEAYLLGGCELPATAQAAESRELRGVIGAFALSYYVVSRIAAPRKLPVIVALQPSMATLRRGLSERERVILDRTATGGVRNYHRICQNSFATRLGELGMRWTDLSRVADECREELFLDQCHLGDRGNELVAEHLAEHVMELA